MEAFGNSESVKLKILGRFSNKIKAYRLLCHTASVVILALFRLFIQILKYIALLTRC